MIEWTIILLCVLGVILIYEAIALMRGSTTLSAYMYHASQAWPLLPFVVGAVIGIFGAHFFWPWCPA